jgi:uncharacterized peroxidase-related enzyme
VLVHDGISQDSYLNGDEKMKAFNIHTIDTAPLASQVVLEGVRQKIGFIPNVFATIAESPEALEGFVALNGVFGESSLNPEEQQIVLLATSTENNCVYCVAGHTAFAHQIGMPEENIEAMRDMRPLEDEKLQALNNVVRQMVRNRGRVSEGDIRQFMAVGYTRQQFFEVVIGVCVKTFSNYVSIGLNLTLDAAFKEFAWEGRDSDPY